MLRLSGRCPAGMTTAMCMHVLGGATVGVRAPQSAREWTTHESSSLVIVVGGLIGAVVVLGVILLAARARLLAKDAEEGTAGSLLEQLRGMRDRGEVSQAEYDAAKKKAV